jgi:hypothetical protein
MSDIRVQCYAGYRADQRPSRFTIRDREYNVQQLDDQWYSPDATYFRVRADDGIITCYDMMKGRIIGPLRGAEERGGTLIDNELRGATML